MPAENRLPIRLVCTTRLIQEQFLFQTATGRSLKSYIAVSEAELQIFAKNTSGLSAVYNMAIEASIGHPAILVFLHDDLLIGDYFWADRIRSGLAKFDIVGLAGNKRRVLRQPSWAFVDDKFTWDEACNLSGVVGHGSAFPPDELVPYGPTGQECKLLDGLLLAVKSHTLLASGLRFDTEFTYDFYDLDFCRQAERLNLRMGTIPLSVVHESTGNLSSKEWKHAYQKYLRKWKE